MASSKARSKNRSASGKGGRPAAGAGSNGRNPGSRTVPAVSATPNSPRKSANVTPARSPKRTAVATEPEESFEPAADPNDSAVHLAAQPVFDTVLDDGLQQHAGYEHVQSYRIDLLSEAQLFAEANHLDGHVIVDER